MKFLYHLNPKRETGEGSVTAEMFSFTFSDDYYIWLPDKNKNIIQMDF